MIISVLSAGTPYASIIQRVPIHTAPALPRARTQEVCMALTTSGLTNGGVTAHYSFQYDDSLSGPGGIEPARTNAVIAACEADFTQMTNWFGGTALDVNFTIPVNVTQNGGGASWSLSGGNLTVTINPSTGDSVFVRYLLVAE